MLNIRYKEKTNGWPGFMDVFSNLAIILIFLLIVFVLLWTTTSVFNKNSGVRTVNQLRQANAEQAALIEQMKNDESEARRLLLLANNELESKTSSMADVVKAYETKVQELEQQTTNLQNKIQELQSDSDKVTEYKDKVAQLEQQLSSQTAERNALSAQLNNLQEKFDEQTRVQTELATTTIDKLQSELQNTQNEYEKLNQELADKNAQIDELTKYQSAFYKAIKEALGERTIMRPEGDRYIISSDILFASGKFTLSENGKKQLAAIANVIKDFEHKIDPNVKWIIRIDGHTDNKAVLPGTKGYKNNLQLSMLRASAVAKELAKNGVSKRRLIPSGFGELHPLELGKDAKSLQKNRRIELQLTNR